MPRERKPFRSEETSTIEQPILEDITLDFVDYAIANFTGDPGWDYPQYTMARTNWEKEFPNLFARFMSETPNMVYDRAVDATTRQATIRYREVFVADYYVKDGSASADPSFEAVMTYIQEKLVPDYEAHLNHWIQAIPKSYVSNSGELQDKRYRIRTKVLKLENTVMDSNPSSFEVAVLFDWTVGVQVETVEVGNE